MVCIAGGSEGNKRRCINIKEASTFDVETVESIGENGGDHLGEDGERLL